MFSFLFKTGTYYMLWQKLKGQFVYFFVSLVLIVLTFSIYDDIYNILKVSSKESLWVLVLVKYSILIIIISLNINHYKSIKVVREAPKKKLPKTRLDPIEEKMINKEAIMSKTDFILNKYKSKKNA